jgi:DNA-binding transcriptional regulator LsrR (DeoR family)
MPLRIRPKDATPEKALELSQHLTQAQIANAWGVSRQCVWQLIQKAKKKQSSS